MDVSKKSQNQISDIQPVAFSRNLPRDMCDELFQRMDIAELSRLRTTSRSMRDAVDQHLYTREDIIHFDPQALADCQQDRTAIHLGLALLSRQERQRERVSPTVYRVLVPTAVPVLKALGQNTINSITHGLASYQRPDLTQAALDKILSNGAFLQQLVTDDALPRERLLSQCHGFMEHMLHRERTSQVVAANNVSQAAQIFGTNIAANFILPVFALLNIIEICSSKALTPLTPQALENLPEPLEAVCGLIGCAGYLVGAVFGGGLSAFVETDRLRERTKPSSLAFAADQDWRARQNNF